LVGNHKNFGAVGTYRHPAEELQDYDNILFALIPSAALNSERSAVLPTQPSLTYAVIWRHSSMSKGKMKSTIYPDTDTHK